MLQKFSSSLPKDSWEIALISQILITHLVIINKVFFFSLNLDLELLEISEKISSQGKFPMLSLCFKCGVACTETNFIFLFLLSKPQR